MSILAPPQAAAPPSLDLTSLHTTSKSKSIPFQEPPHSPTTAPIIALPIKSPKRTHFFPLSVSPEKKYALPSTPTKLHANTHTHKKTLSYPLVSTSTPAPSHTRTNTRFSNVSTAVGSANSPSPSPDLGMRPRSASGGGALPLPSSLYEPTSRGAAPNALMGAGSVQGHARAKSEFQAQSQAQKPTLTKTQTQTRRPQTATSTPSGPLTKPPTYTSTRLKLADHTTSQTIPGKPNPPQTASQRIKEGTFFAFVLLPLSCWYTRGGKRLKELDMRELEEDRASRAQSQSQSHAQKEKEQSIDANGRARDEMRMPPRAAVPGNRKRGMSFDGYASGRARTFTSGSQAAPEFGTRMGGRGNVRERRSFDDTSRRPRAGSDGGRTGSLRRHPDFDFEIERVPLVRRTTTSSGILRELTPGRAM